MKEETWKVLNQMDSEDVLIVVVVDALWVVAWDKPNLWIQQKTVDGGSLVYDHTPYKLLVLEVTLKLQMRWA